MIHQQLSTSLHLPSCRLSRSRLKGRQKRTENESENRQGFCQLTLASPPSPPPPPPPSLSAMASKSSSSARNTSRLSHAGAATSRHPSSGHVSSSLAPAWPFNPQDTALIRAGYNPAFKPASTATQTKMAEPRARVPRQKGQMNFPTERMPSLLLSSLGYMLNTMD